MTDDRRNQAGSSKRVGDGAIPGFDLYAVLNVRPDATQQEIREAVATMDGRLHAAAARQRGGSTARQKRFNVARHWLLDPERRRRYDAAVGRGPRVAAGPVRGRIGGGSATRRRTTAGPGAYLGRPLAWVGIAAVLAVVVVAFIILRPGSSSAGSSVAGSPSVSGARSQGAPGSGCPTSQPPAAPRGQSELVTIATPKGAMEITIVNDLSPIAAGNFVALASCGYYDGVVFHRVVPNFVIQGGDPTGTGTGGPGYTIQDEPVTTAYGRRTVAMARTSAPNSVGSQFFIVLSDDARTALQSANTYQIIGSVTKGMEVADAIAAAADKENPTNPIPMTSVTASPPEPHSPSPSGSASPAASVGITSPSPTSASPSASSSP